MKDRIKYAFGKQWTRGGGTPGPAAQPADGLREIQSIALARTL